MAPFPLEERFRSGRELYGDDFDTEAIAAWFRDEENAYATLWAERGDKTEYGYHALNWWHGFRHLPAGPLGPVLAYGSAHGKELEPLGGRLSDVTLLDASEAFDTPTFPGAVVQKHKAQMSGDLPFSAEAFALITCFGVLHHIPNVSHVLSEFARTLRSGGFVLLREPTTSMGTWDRPRPGLTPRERGIPRGWMVQRLVSAGLRPLQVTPCQFSPLMALSRRVGLSYARLPTIWLDAALSSAFAWNQRYVSETTWQKVRPGSAFYIAQKVS